MLPVILFVLTLGSFVAIGKLASNEKKVMWYVDRANEGIALATDAKTDSESGLSAFPA